MKKIPLTQVKTNQKVKVAEITGGGQLRDKLMSLGIYTGIEITKLSHFMMKGPVTIKSGRSVLALGHGMAAKIFVESHD